MTSTTFYQQMGGEQGIRKLINLFYDYMDDLPESQGIRDMHAKNLKVSREKLFLFISGWSGGPDIYIEKYGQPVLRRRHLSFAIGSSERDQWMLCMKKALADMSFNALLEQQLIHNFMATADHMRNQPDHLKDITLINI